MNKPSRLTLLALCTGLLTSLATTLPDDREQEVQVNADSSEARLNEGIVIYYGSVDEPAVVTQGSLRISGEEITIVRDQGQPRRITALGSPARFQMQPAVDQAVVHGSASNIIFDNPAQLLTMEEEAVLRQENNRLSGHFIEYDLENNRTSARSRDGEDRINMTIQPENAE